MSEPEVSYERYLVRAPRFIVGPGFKNRQSPTMTFMSWKQVAEANCVIEFGWIYGVPEPNPHIHEHVHTFNEIVMHFGGDPDNPEELGGEIEFYVGGQPLIFDTTSAIFVPKGVRHGPLIWKSFSKPHIEMTIILGTGSPKEVWASSGITDAKEAVPQKTDNVDYERYMVRRPVHERGSDAMTLMSSSQVPEAPHFVQLDWIYGVPDPNPRLPETKRGFDGILLNIGADPANPEALGAEIELRLGGQPLTINTTSSCWVPKGLAYGPITWKRVERPHMQMSILFDCGSTEACKGNTQ